LVRRLDLYTSGRTERVEQTRADRPGDTFSNTGRLYAYGLRYDPVQGLTLRAARSIGVKPPTFTQALPWTLANSRVQNITDPARPGATFTLEPDMYVQGGNPDLIPETTASTNIGLILTPRRFSGLRISVDYLESLRE